MAKPTDLLTLNEAKTAVNLPQASGAAELTGELEMFVTGISSRVDALCGPVVHRAVTGERHDGGRRRVFLRETPVSAVTSAAEWSRGTETVLSAESDATLPADGYLLDHSGLYSFVWRRSAGEDSKFPAGRRNVVITYTAGRYATTATVSEQFKLATAAVLRRIWKREQSAWAQSPDFFPDTDNPAPSMTFFKAVDPMIKELLMDELLPPVGL